MKLIISFFLVCLVLLSSCSEDGKDAPGFKGADKLGNISLTFTGKRPDGKEFKATQVFRYADVGSSSSTPVGELMQHDITRFNYSLAESVRIKISASEAFQSKMSVSTYIIEGTELFLIDFKNYTDTEPVKFDYNSENGKLTYTFDFVVPEDKNSTGYDLSVSGNANVTTFQEID